MKNILLLIVSFSLTFVPSLKSAVILDFDTLSDDEQVVSQFSSLGVIFKGPFAQSDPFQSDPAEATPPVWLTSEPGNPADGGSPSPITGFFVDPADSTRLATTDFVSLRAIYVGNTVTATLTVFNLFGVPLESVSVQNDGDLTIQRQQPDIASFRWSIAGFDDVTGIDDFEFNSPTPSNVTYVNFDGFPDDTLLTNQYASQGVVFDGVSYIQTSPFPSPIESSPPGWVTTNSGDPSTGGPVGPISGQFVDSNFPHGPATTDCVALRAIFVSATNQTKLEAFDINGDSLGFDTLLNDGVLSVCAEGIASFVWSQSESDNIIGVDNLVFSQTVAINEPPIAVAGEDQCIRAGDLVQLDGSNSFDDNTSSENLIYNWYFTEYPGLVEPPLSDPETPYPSFVADLIGTYILELVVTDEGGVESIPDEVVVSSDNIAPTAVATSNFTIYIVGDNAILDGTESFDPDNDPIAYDWSIVSSPAGSSATISNTSNSTPTIILDVEGIYEVALTVSDPIGPGSTDTVSFVATTALEYAEIKIIEASDIILDLEPNQITKPGHQKSLSNDLKNAIKEILKGKTGNAVGKLNSALDRTDGCVLRGSPDENGPSPYEWDYVTDCSIQAELYTLLTEAITALSE